MATLERVAAELAGEHYWWGRAAAFGWVVLDRQDVRNDGDTRQLIRCSDWSAVVVTREEFGSERFVGFRKYLATLPLAEAEHAGDELLAFHREFASRAAGLRVTAADLERQDREARLQNLRQREEDALQHQEAQRQAVRAGGWLTCDNPRLLLDCLPVRPSGRKLRLFGIACLRRVWDQLTFQDCRKAVLLVEQYVEGAADPGAVQQLRKQLGEKWWAARQRPFRGWQTKIRLGFLGAVQCLLREYATDEPTEPEPPDLSRLWEPAALAKCWAHDRNSTFYYAELSAQADLLRDLLGNPFQSSANTARWVGGADSTVTRVAQAIYHERRFEDLPILADAFQDAGCDDDIILTHCRGPGPHARGCWVVDAVLGWE